MADARASRHDPPDGVVRPRRPARRRGDDHQGPVPVAPRVVVYHAPDCRLCGDAIEVIRAVRAEADFELELVDISGDPALETRYREHLPVVEIDGERVFTLFVDADDLRERLER